MDATTKIKLGFSPGRLRNASAIASATSKNASWATVMVFGDIGGALYRLTGPAREPREDERQHAGGDSGAPASDRRRSRVRDRVEQSERGEQIDGIHSPTNTTRAEN